MHMGHIAQSLRKLAHAIHRDFFSLKNENFLAEKC